MKKRATSQEVQIVVAKPVHALSELDDSIKHAEKLREKARSDNTRKAYKSDWIVFESWCNAKGVASLPSTPRIVAAFISDLVLGKVLKYWSNGKSRTEGKPSPRKMSTILRYMSSITHEHITHRHLPPTQHPAVIEELEGARRELTVKKDQKDAVTIELLLKLLPFVKGLAKIRDRAILFAGFYMGSRRSEITNLNIDDIKFDKDRAVIEVRKSKGDQHGEGMAKFIPKEGAAPLRELVADLRSQGITSGPLFRAVSRNGAYRARHLNDKYVATLIKQTVCDAREATGDESFAEERFSGHSLRAGLVTTLAERGEPSHRIQKKTGHALSSTVDGYIRDRRIRSEKDWEDDPTYDLLGKKDKR